MKPILLHKGSSPSVPSRFRSKQSVNRKQLEITTVTERTARRVLPVKNKKNPSVTGGLKEETLGLSQQERPFLFTAVTYTQVGVPMGRTENEQIDCSKKEREKTEGQRARGNDGTTE
ncbi:hypothetical protein M9H77_06257 [Catharanthus roseus]|uniref:Uncharacterized protein n=1 Tax=Catharanthus roseus TaxID=4058 RepID=A0ACC0BRK4_CATRO|nr:hypothetical protein M9H77_06257 [Catharanthus roseus]